MVVVRMVRVRNMSVKETAGNIKTKKPEGLTTNSPYQ